MLTGNGEISCRFPFMEAPVWRKLPVPEEGLCQVRHGCDLVKFMDSILIAVVVDDEWKNSLWWGGNTGTNAMTLEARVTWDCHIAGLAGGHGCKGTECTLFEAAAGPGPEVGLSVLKLLVDRRAGFGPLGALRCGPYQGAGPRAEEGPGCEVVMRVLGENAREWCAGQRCELDVVCRGVARACCCMVFGRLPVPRPSHVPMLTLPPTWPLSWLASSIGLVLQSSRRHSLTIRS